MYISASTQEVPSNLLVIGIDGSGKTTFLTGLHDEFDYEIMEPTSDEKARKFKISTLETPIDKAYIAERESIYLALNGIFEATIQDYLSSGTRVATTGSKLVTSVSHATMHGIVSDGSLDEPINATRDWLTSDGTLLPDAIVFIHAPEEIILSRIQERQDGGDKAEKFWGFNAPFFLLRYQAVWERVIDEIDNSSSIETLSLDSSLSTPAEMLSTFSLKLGTGYDECS